VSCLESLVGVGVLRNRIGGLADRTVVTMDFADYAAMRRPALVRSAVLLGCTVDDAEDLVQVTLTKCLLSWRRVSRAQRPDAYVYRVLLNAFRADRSRRWHGETPTAELPDAALPDVDVELGLAVRRALLALSKEHREVLVLRFYADLSERETAEALGIPSGTVKSRTARALEALSADQNVVRTPDAD
jgi:RNA polymerase sigma-70 factor (sigma-E family)